MVFDHENRPKTTSTQRMLPPKSPDRIYSVCDDHRFRANAEQILSVTLVHHLELGELVDRHVELRDAPIRASGGDNLLNLMPSTLAAGNCIDARRRAGGTDVKPSAECATLQPPVHWPCGRTADSTPTPIVATCHRSFSRQRRLAGDADHCAQLGTLDDAPRFG